MVFENILKSNKNFINENANVYFSPGRVNLIGEHIDYLGGNVFPTAINLGTYAFVTRREDKEFHFLSHNFHEEGVKVVTLDSLEYDESRSWANYPIGILLYMIRTGLHVPFGLNVLIYGTLPNGAGLSSSASLEVLMGTILCNEFDFDMKMFDLVQLSQKVENEYIGVNCGIMDQFAVGMSKMNHAIYLNTNSLDYELVPLDLGDYTLVIANTNKKRTLADSKYNQRRLECDQGLIEVNRFGKKYENLCSLSPHDFESIRNKFQHDVIRNRVEHGVYENHRTKEALVYLNQRNLVKFGELMNQSHDSLRDLYEVSCKELDTLVNSFRKHGAIGARMTGAGFGGCIISLVKTDIVGEVILQVQKEYLQIIGYEADFYPCKTSDGAKMLGMEEII